MQRSFAEKDIMATDLQAAPAPPADQIESFNSAISGDCVLVRDVPWKMHRRLRRMPAYYNIRMTFDRGELEIMSPSVLHEKIASLLGDLINVWRIELGIPMVSCRTTTIRRSALQRGFEPDNCYYIQHLTPEPRDILQAARGMEV